MRATVTLLYWLSSACVGAASFGCSSAGPSGAPQAGNLSSAGSLHGTGGGASGGAGTSGVTPPLGGTAAGGGSGFVPNAAGGAGPIGNPGSSGNAPGAGGVANVGIGNAPSVGAGGSVNPGNVGGFGNVGGSVAPMGGSAGAGGVVVQGGGPPGTPAKGCEGETMPAVTDYSKNGPLPTTVVNSTGSDGNFTIYRPTTLGANGFKHPVATWGNGITTTPSFYPGLLGAIASHGFVVIASNSSSVTAELMTAGLDWMVAQNATAGDYQGKLNPTCLVTVGYSLGGGASVGAGAHANVVATASMHGVTGPSNALHAPLLLLTAETDTFVVPATFVTPTFTASSVQTFYGTLSTAADTSNEGHLIPVDGALSLITAGGANLDERAAVVAWLRLWVFGDQGAKPYFYGDDCVLCKDPWVTAQRKNWK